MHVGKNDAFRGASTECRMNGNAGRIKRKGNEVNASNGVRDRKPCPLF